jgi:16S rRNA (uracil1498-N3)-methyltransferase
MHRFFIDPEDLTDTRAVLTGEEAHHLISVLRLKVGVPIQLFDGLGKTYEAEIEKISTGRVEAAILSMTEEPAAEKTKLHLGLALLKGKKMDFVMQKATELGVAGLHPFLATFSNARHMEANREAKRLERWQKITREACKQCNRPKPPTCYPVKDFNTLLEEASQADYDLKLLFWEGERSQGLHGIAQGPDQPCSVMILIGPEGGFSMEEAAQAKAAGFQPITLGKRIMRAETAAVAAIAILQHQLGNLE